MNDICATEEQLSAYLDGELRVDEARVVELHIESCRRCEERLGALRGLCATLRMLGERQPSVNIVPALQRRLEGATCRDRAAVFGWRPWQLVPLSMAAAITLTFGVMLGTALTAEPVHEHAAFQWMAPFEPIPPAEWCAGSRSCLREG